MVKKITQGIILHILITHIKTQLFDTNLIILTFKVYIIKIAILYDKRVFNSIVTGNLRRLPV